LELAGENGSPCHPSRSSPGTPDQESIIPRRSHFAQSSRGGRSPAPASGYLPLQPQQRRQEIHAERARKLEAARQKRQSRRRQAAGCTRRPVCATVLRVPGPVQSRPTEGRGISTSGLATNRQSGFVNVAPLHVIRLGECCAGTKFPEGGFGISSSRLLVLNSSGLP
jgi:hypothetical protein